jgi:SWI/SNF-related matrix-associated actin-dependent regulator 1 of chromatin subfamily A
MPRIVAALKGRVGVAICDESHYLKSPTAQRTKACSPLLKGVKRLVLLSGTPALARPCELYSQVSCLRPKMFPSRREFEKRYCDPRRGRWGMDVTGAANLSELYGVLQRHFMIRR